MWTGQGPPGAYSKQIVAGWKFDVPTSKRCVRWMYWRVPGPDVAVWLHLSKAIGLESSCMFYLF